MEPLSGRWWASISAPWVYLFNTDIDDNAVEAGRDMAERVSKHYEGLLQPTPEEEQEPEEAESAKGNGNHPRPRSRGQHANVQLELREFLKAALPQAECVRVNIIAKGLSDEGLSYQRLMRMASRPSFGNVLWLALDGDRVGLQRGEIVDIMMALMDGQDEHPATPQSTAAEWLSR